jgi:hypothetical protein
MKEKEIARLENILNELKKNSLKTLKEFSGVYSFRKMAEIIHTDSGRLNKIVNQKIDVEVETLIIYLKKLSEFNQ